MSKRIRGMLLQRRSLRHGHSGLQQGLCLIPPHHSLHYLLLGMKVEQRERSSNRKECKAMFALLLKNALHVPKITYMFQKCLTCSTVQQHLSPRKLISHIVDSFSALHCPSHATSSLLAVFETSSHRLLAK